MRTRHGWLILASVVLLSTGLPTSVSVHEFVVHASGPLDCEPAALGEQPSYAHPLVRQRWERASAVAPNACLISGSAPVWECYYSEPVGTEGKRLCWWPIPLDLPGDAPARLEVMVDLALLRSLAQTAFEDGAVTDLLGGGASLVEVRVDDVAALMRVQDAVIQSAVPLTAPSACTPFDAGAAVVGPDDAKGVCALSHAPRAGQCRAVADADVGYLCWWGLRPAPSADVVLEMNADTIRAILNAEDQGAATKWALKQGYLTVWASDATKRAGIKAALEFGIGDVPDPLPPLGDANSKLKLQGRLFDVTYFPRDGALAPCARDGAGTWYWLNAFGAPNGFVGSNTIRAMQLYLAEHGQLPDQEDVLTDLLVNYRPGTMVDGPGGSVAVTYLFLPGSPFALIPAIETQGKVVKLKGDGSVDGELTAAEATAAAGRIAAGKAVAKDVDFNRQPGTLAQDLRFLRYAVSRNPAAPQIEVVLRTLGNGSMPAAEDLAGMFPADAPRLAHLLAKPIEVPGRIAGGDAMLLGMASHTLIWQDLVANGAIQPTAPEVPQ